MAYTKKEIIKKFIIKHGNKYDYSLVNFENIKKNIIIKCKKCGNIFSQRPDHHLNGSGCKYYKYYTKKTYLEKVKKIHNNKYDYSLIKNHHYNKKIKIICPIHGVFEQNPICHITSGCPKCVGKNIITEDIIKESKTIYDNLFNYSKTIFINKRISMLFVCNKCGNIQKETYKNHILGNGCIRCNKKKEFIKKAKEIYKNNYNYSNINFINFTEKIKIYCNNCNKYFYKKPTIHICKRNQGCPYCKNSKGENKIYEILEKMKIFFVKEKRFENCKDKNSLPFDYYLPNYNLCIEYDGEQHFKSIDVFGGKDVFKDRIKKDNIKNNFCNENNIKLLRIPYYDFENMENILKNYIK